MAKKASNPKVDGYVGRAENWQDAVAQLRAIALDCPLSEELKWGVPCYTFDDSNIVLIHTFKQYCALLFFKGALMKDTEGILVQQTKNVQSARQVRFTDAQQVARLKAVLKAYIHEAIEIEKAGLTVDFKQTEEFAMPEEFQTRLAQAPALKAAFEALTPGRQRGYLLHFSVPKQAKTREARVAKCTPQILSGKGLNDQ